jgi:hypothetical protein
MKTRLINVIQILLSIAICLVVYKDYGLTMCLAFVWLVFREEAMAWYRNNEQSIKDHIDHSLDRTERMMDNLLLKAKKETAELIDKLK